MKNISNTYSKQASRTVVLYLSILATVLAVACSEPNQEGNLTENNAAKKKIGVLIFDDALTSDMTGPLEVFGHASHQPDFEYQVLAISVAADRKATTYEGLQLRADYSIADAPDLDVLIVPGSYSMDPLFANKDLLKFLQTQGARVEYLASNCAGAFLLGHAGLLDGRRATTYLGGDGLLKKTYPAVDAQSGQSIVQDGNLITSYGGVVSFAAAQVLLEKISGAKTAAAVSDAIYADRLQDYRRPQTASL